MLDNEYVATWTALQGSTFFDIIWNMEYYNFFNFVSSSAKRQKYFLLETGCKQQHLLGIVSAILLIVEILIVEFKC